LFPVDGRAGGHLWLNLATAEMAFFYFGHHKSGSTWIASILQTIARHLHGRYLHAYTPEAFSRAIRQIDDGPTFVSYVNAEPAFVAPLVVDAKGIHVVRDPRDLAVSAYFSHRFTHSLDHWPELRRQRQILDRLDMTDGILATLEFLESMRVDGQPVAIFSSMNDWNYECPNVLELRFEDLIRNPIRGFESVCSHFGIHDAKVRTRSGWSRLWRRTPQTATLAAQVARIVADADPFAHRHRRPGEVDLRSHYRHGVPGDWKTHFSDVHVTWFKRRYPQLLVRLGYEH